MSILHFDIETFSEEDLKSSGVYRYAEHPSTEILCLGYAFDDEVPVVWVPMAPSEVPPALSAALMELAMTRADGSRYPVRNQILFQKSVPPRIVGHIKSGGECRMHNAQFERVVLNGTAGDKIGFPRIDIKQTVCTAAKVAAHGLPRALGDCAEALDTHRKSDVGRIEMLQLCKPRKPTKADPNTRWLPETAPEKFAVLYAYNIDDVLAERAIDAAVPDLPASEQRIYELDQKINERGVRVDLEGIANVQSLIEEYKAGLAEDMEFLTDLKPTQRDKLADWIRANGYPQLFDMTADTVRYLCTLESVPKLIKQVLRIYSTYNAKAVSKYDAILNAVCRDERIHGMFLFDGANTGRWSSLIVQLQNLFRPVIEDPENAIELFMHRSLKVIREAYPDHDPMKIFASCVRGMLIAGSGMDLQFLDYAGIESRGCAWLFDEDWKLEAFRAFDRGDSKWDNYVAAYAKSFKVDPASVTKALRQIGKVMELFMQYEGGVGAFVTGAESYNIDLAKLAETVLPTLPEDVKAEADKMWHDMPQHRGDQPYDIFVACDSLKRLWRRSHPKIQRGWKDLKSAAEMAVQHPGKAFLIPNGKIAFKVIEYRGRSWLYMRLPSGRRLAYYKPRWIPDKEVVERDPVTGHEFTTIVPGELRYWGNDTYTRRWMEVSTYGGKLCENAVQALSACVLRAGMLAVEEAGYPIIGTVHDEIMMEPLKGEGSMDEAAALMCRELPWAKGLPLAAEGHRTKRYRK